MINKRIKQISQILSFLATNPLNFLVAGFNASTEDAKRKYISNTFGLKDGLPTVDLLGLFPTINEEVITPYTYLTGTSDITDLLILKLLSKKYKDCSYLEIGTWRGESLANVSKVAKDCISLNLSDKDLKKIGYSDKYISLQRFFSKNLKNVKHIQADSHTFNFLKLNKKFDLIFIDGDHRYEGVKKDTENAFKLLKNKDSIIVWHDCKENSEIVNWAVLAGVLDGCPSEKRKGLYAISNSKCVIYSSKKLPAKFLTTPQIPQTNFSVKISAKRIN